MLKEKIQEEFIMAFKAKDDVKKSALSMLKAKITEEVRPGVLSSTFHFPEIMLNNITSDIQDSEALCPEYKVVACRIRKSKGKYKVPQ